MERLTRAITRILLASLVFPATLLAGDTGKIAGRITDKTTGEPLAAANISVLGTMLGAATNLEGQYTILNVPPGTHTLRATLIGYGTVVINDVRVYIEQSATSISVRRPNLVADSCTVNVVSDSALVVAKADFGKIDRVMDRFGSFADGIALAAVTADSAGNLIIVSGVAPITIWRVSPGGDKSIIAASGSTLRAPFDATIRNGEIYLTGNNREIQKVNLTTGASTRWTQLPSGRVVKCGDFDTEGYYYTGGGTGADLCIVSPNPPSTLTLAQIRLSGIYAAEELMAIRFSRGFLYVASRTSASAPARIWRHSVSTGGTLGNQEPVANLGAYAAFSSRTVRAMSFAASGEVYLTTDATDPLLICNPANATLDYYYKGIVPPFGNHAYWGSGVYLYMVSGDPDNADTALRWNIARVTSVGRVPPANDPCLRPWLHRTRAL